MKRVAAFLSFLWVSAWALPAAAAGPAALSPTAATAPAALTVSAQASLSSTAGAAPSPLGPAAAAQAVSPSAASDFSAPPPAAKQNMNSLFHQQVRLPRAQWSDQGFEYRFSLGVLKLANGQALSYLPVEVGYRFDNGWRLRLGLEAFYYKGLDIDSTTGPSPQLFYYQMEDIRFSALYEWFRHHALRPFAGLTLESVFGTRQLAVNPTPDQAESFENAYSFEAPGAEAGLEYRGGPSWSLSLEARYVLGAGSWANVAGSDLGWHYLF